jgi:hypothetical protein
MSVPTLDVTIHYRVVAQSTTRSYTQHYALGWFAGERPLTDDRALPEGTRCSEDGIRVSEGTFEDSLPATFTAGLSKLFVPQRSTSDGSCAGRTIDERATPELTTIDIAQLGRPDGVLIEGTMWSVHIWATAR